MADTTPLPPDRSHVLTEQRNPRSSRLHELGVGDIVSLINSEDMLVAPAVAAASVAIARFTEAVEPGFLAGGRLVYLGAGTSGRLGVLDASECPPTFQTPPERVIGIIAGGDGALRRSSEGREDEPRGAVPDLESLHLTSRDAVLGIAAGGTTAYVRGALEYCRSLAAPPVTGLLTCSPVREGVAPGVHVICVEVGPEVLTGSTRMKAGTATKLVLNTISTTLMVRAGRVYENLMVDLRATNDKLRDRAARVVSTLTGLDRAASLVLLDRAGGLVKTAVVMHRRALTREQADALLASCAGRLAGALASP
jgi:N-acetylmuramic acid 6-phosphate etherase